MPDDIFIINFMLHLRIRYYGVGNEEQKIQFIIFESIIKNISCYYGMYKQNFKLEFKFKIISFFKFKKSQFIIVNNAFIIN